MNYYQIDVGTIIHAETGWGVVLEYDQHCARIAWSQDTEDHLGSEWCPIQFLGVFIIGPVIELGDLHELL